MKILEKLKNDRQDLISKLCDNIDSLERIALEQQAEIERLEEENRGLRKICDRALKTYKETKAEAIKEFAERVKQEINFPLAVWKVFDNLVKEMVGE